MSSSIADAKATFKDMPKVEGKPAPQGELICDVIYDHPSHKMIVQFRSKTTGQIVAWAVMNEPLNFCEVVDKFRSADGRA